MDEPVPENGAVDVEAGGEARRRIASEANGDHEHPQVKTPGIPGEP
jgi:hypothetical protein